ncbi:helix-turn-helix domain-containing protein [Sphingosinithalassobacter portus]|uniref:helix-turn-helix domain-containing protein n=1 Tax=Stakelama portus TaxID=2676234 RepID=UPI0011AB859B|nr:AraC family transcriptional regulator [Sphingosinithalassobacter portus]
MTSHTPHMSYDRSGTTRIAVLLKDAATLVAHDPAATLVRLEEISALLVALPAASPCESSIVLRLLAPWQARRVREFIDAHLEETIRIETLAEHTRLSVSYFFRAFRGTFGMPPHAFIVQCRTDRAMAMLAESDEPIAQIAIACGFADQAHFSRAFARRAGLPPGAWRRLQRGGVSISA